MIPVKQSTAFTWKAGPFIDDTDGKTPETGLTIGQADIRISKAGGNYAQSNNSAGATHDEIGEYDVPLDTTDTNTVGPMKVMIQKTGALPVWQWFDVLPANVYDSRYGADRLQVHVDEMTADIITAAVLASDVVTELQAGLATASALATVDTVVDGIKAVTDVLPDAGALTSLATAAALATVDGNVDAILVDTGTDIPATLATMAGYIDTEVGAIKAKTDNLPSDPADASDIVAAFGVVGSAISALNNISSGDVETAVGAALATYDPPTKAELDSAIAALNNISVADILAGGNIDGYSVEETLKIAIAVLAGKVSGAATATNVFRDLADTLDRVTTTADADGNRTAVTLNV